MKNRVLYISSFLPTKNANQAGVNITYNLINLISSNLNSEVDVLCTLNQFEYDNDDRDLKEISRNQKYFPLDKKRKITNILSNIGKPLICGVRFDKRVREYIKNCNEEYDYIIIDYTQNISYIDDLKKRYPRAKIAIIEHDVSFLGFKRKLDNSKGIKKLFYAFEYNRLKKYEINKLKLFDKIYTLNEKDKNLIKDINNVEIITPFIGKWDFENKEHDTFNLMYWGAMNRKENEVAVLEFIDKVWNKIDKTNIKFYIIGSKPSEKIKRLSSDNVIVTGFVENPADYFGLMDLSIVPLTLGAGIKIKVLESLANGIPVITTNVGAEGIPYTDELIVTDNIDEFAKYIDLLKNDSKKRNEMINKSKELIDKNFGFKANENVLARFIRLR